MDLNPIDEGQLGRAGFVKQRRNLLVISVLLAAGLWVGVSFEPLRAITIYCRELLLLTRPEGIAHVAWMVWLYFLIRYVGFHLEYQKHEEKFVFLFRNRLNSAYSRIMFSKFQKQGMATSVYYNAHVIRATVLGASYYIQMRLPGSTDPSAVGNYTAVH